MADPVDWAAELRLLEAMAAAGVLEMQQGDKRMRVGDMADLMRRMAYARSRLAAESGPTGRSRVSIMVPYGR